MANVLQFGINMSMLMSGNIATQAVAACKSLSELGRKAQELQKSAGKIQAFQKQRGAIEATRQKLVAAREKVRLLRAEMSRTEKPTAAMKSAFGKAQADAGRLAEKLLGQQKSLATLNSELVKSGVNTSKLIDEQNKLAANTDKVRAAQDRLTRAQENYSSLRSRLFDWGNIKADVMSAAGLAMTLREPLRISMDYEQAMSQVKAVLNPTQEEFTQLREQALMLVRTTQFSAKQSANAQENLARGGMNTRQILGLMPTVLDVAASDGMEIAKAADIISGAMRGFNLHDSAHDTQKEAARIGDILAYVSSHTATNVSMAGAAMQGVSGTAFTQHITPEQVGAYIGVLANRAGLQGQEAATTLERSISALAVRKGDTDKVLTQYKIATKTRSGGLVRLEEIVRKLFVATEKKGPAEQQAAFMKVFGKAYGGDMLKFAQGIFSGELETLTQGLKEERNGSARNMAAVRNDNLAGDLVSLSSAWEGFMESVGNPLQDWSRNIVQTVTSALNVITDFVKKHEILAELAVKIGAAYAAWKIGGTVLKYTRLLIQLPAAWAELKLAEHAANLAAMGTNAGTLAANMGGAAASAGIFGSSLSTVLVTIGGIVTASILIWQNWEKITEWCTKAGEAMMNFDTGKVQSAKAGTLSRSDPDYGLAVMNSTYAPYQPHAKGGILTQPHFGLVAEAGPEAIIPLRDKARGIPLVLQAMNILGMNEAVSRSANVTDITRSANNITSTRSANTTALTQSADSITSTRSASTGIFTRSANITDITNTIVSTREAYTHERYGDNRAASTVSNNNTRNIGISPQVNMTVNITGSAADTDIASRIKQAVIDALSEIAGYQERVAYA